MAQKYRWHATPHSRLQIPDSGLAEPGEPDEVEAMVESKARRELVTNGQRTVGCGDGLPITGGFASLQPEDADYAVEVCRQQDPIVRCCVQLRLEPEHHVTAKRLPAADQPASDAMVESKTRYVRDPDFSPPPDDDQPP